MKKVPLILSANELQVLKESYTTAGLLSTYNQNRLESELKDPKIVDQENLPSNVVSFHSKVLVWNMSKSQTFTIHIVPAINSAVNNLEVNPSDPLSLALLGYREGCVIEWEMPDGINQYKIISVSKIAVLNDCK